MTVPALLLGFLISTLYGAAFYLLRGGNASRFLLSLILGWLGFWAGQMAAEKTGLTFLSVGPLHLGMATIGSLLVLGLGYWLSMVETEKKQSS